MGKSTDSGILEYQTVTLPINFPKGKMSCQYCPALRRDYNTDLHKCWQTGEPILDIKNKIGQECPMRDYNW